MTKIAPCLSEALEDKFIAFRGRCWGDWCNKRTKKSLKIKKKLKIRTLKCKKTIQMKKWVNKKRAKKIATQSTLIIQANKSNSKLCRYPSHNSLSLTTMSPSLKMTKRSRIVIILMLQMRTSATLSSESHKYITLEFTFDCALNGVLGFWGFGVLGFWGPSRAAMWR